MKNKLSLLFGFIYLCICSGCSSQSIKRVELDPNDIFRGHYLVLEPEGKIKGGLILLNGFGQHSEDLIPESKLPQISSSHGILTIVFAGGNKLYADSIVQISLNNVLNDVIKKYKLDPKNFVIGGFSAGGMISLRYTELCHQFPNKFPILPSGVFTVDSPIDIFKIYEDLEATKRNNYSEPAVEEATRAIAHINAEYGIPRENPEVFANLNAFNMDKKYGEPEKYLKDVAVRTYHDVDIPWRLINRNQTVHEANFYVTSELINRLLLMGNSKAEFIQSTKKGFRSNGQRHPHSWSIVDEEECVQWIMSMFK